MWCAWPCLINLKRGQSFLYIIAFMKLYIDTSNREKIVVGVDGEMFETEARQDKSQKLLKFIDEVLSRRAGSASGRKMEEITEIEVNPGPGSFTGLRVGVSVANALGWVLKVPVNGKRIDKGETVEITYGKV